MILCLPCYSSKGFTIPYNLFLIFNSSGSSLVSSSQLILPFDHLIVVNSVFNESVVVSFVCVHRISGVSYKPTINVTGLFYTYILNTENLNGCSMET